MMVDFKKLMEEEPVIAQDVERHMKNLEEFEEWLRKNGCSRVYEYLEKRTDRVVIFTSGDENAKPSISIWLPRWW